MSNTSYSFKENSHVIVNQGGEKKVMKKILSVALSTAMAFSMFASVAFGADAKLTPEQQFNALKEAGIVSGFPDGLSHLERTLTRAELAKIIVNSLSLEPVDATSYNDKNYANHWGRPYIEAATQAGILNGKDAVKKLFDPNGAVTVQELAKVLVTALELEVPADANNTASEWAKGYVAAAVNAGYLADGINYQAQATRSQAVVAAYAIYEAAQFKVTKAEAIDATHVKLTLSNGETVEVTLEKALEPNKATELEYTTADGKVLKYTVTYVVTDATKVEKVTADNLREVVVTFDGEVDEATATDESNYSINKNIAVKSASLSSDKRSVTLTVESTTTAETGLVNQTEYELDVTNVRAGNKVINASDVKFTPVDAALPVAQSAEALGNKAIKVTFSEPIKPSSVSANNFKIDGVSVVGTIDVSGKVAVVKLYNSIATGEHTVNVAGVKDYFGLANLATDLKINVVEDTTAPTVSVEKATFEEVTLKFSEPVDKSTVTAGNIYWLESSTKRYAQSVEAVSDDTYKVSFANYPLKYATALYISNVTDYSGNAIAADTKVEVNPVVDQTRPEVVSVKFLENSSTDFDVKFTKGLTQSTAETASNYVIKKSDGTVVSQFKTATLIDSKTVRVHLYTGLSAGTTYTLEISNVSDNTTLKNVMLPYTTTITLGDTTPPELKGASFSNVAHRVVVTFNEAMATSGAGSILDKANYIYYKEGNFKSDTGAFENGAWTALPSDATIIASSDSKSAIIIFPSDFETNKVTGIRVTSVKDAAGNTLKGLVAETKVNPFVDVTVSGVKATAVDKIAVTFSENIQSATANDFEVTAGGGKIAVIGVAIDGAKVTLTLAEDLTTDAKFGGSAVNVAVKSNNNIVTPTGAKALASSTNPVVDAISPTIKSISNVYGGVATVTFTEAINLNTNGAYDLEVLADGDTLVLGEDKDYTVGASGTDGLAITLSKAALDKYKGKVLDVRVKPYPSFITDTKDNVVAGGSSFFSAYIPTDVAAPTATVDKEASTSTNLKLKLNEVATVVVTGDSAEQFTVSVDPTDSKKVTISSDTDIANVTFTVTDEAGNVTSYTATYSEETWTLVSA